LSANFSTIWRTDYATVFSADRSSDAAAILPTNFAAFHSTNKPSEHAAFFAAVAATDVTTIPTANKDSICSTYFCAHN
jgi:hypothetical protein